VTDPKKSKEIPVTQQMLYSVRNELKSDITSVKLEVSAVEKRMGARFDKVNARFEEVNARFEKMDAKFDSLLSEVKSQNAQFHRMLTLFEELENRNKYVLDGYTSLNDRLERVENSINSLP